MNGVDEFQYPFSGIQAIVDTEDISLTGTVNVTSFRPGPAGTTTTYVGDGVVVEVDFAAPVDYALSIFRSILSRFQTDRSTT